MLLRKAQAWVTDRHEDTFEMNQVPVRWRSKFWVFVGSPIGNRTLSALDAVRVSRNQFLREEGASWISTSGCLPGCVLRPAWR